MEEAKPEDVAASISHALLFNGRKRNHEADELMARITAKHLVEHGAHWHFRQGAGSTSALIDLPLCVALYVQDDAT